MAWHQLTYAHAPKSDERSGGWGVIETTEGIPVDVRDRLEAGVVTSLDELRPTGEFANRGELAARVRSLTYEPCGVGGTWWHAVAAGKDATGRPGNVFTHAAAVDDLDSLRPADLWRSPAWLVPFGAGEVAAATLGVIGSKTGSGSDASFLDLATSRPGAVECVISAVAWCFENDRALVLAAPTQDVFVDWLCLVSRLTSVTVAGQIPFCTFVRAADMRDRAAQFEILGLAIEDLPVTHEQSATMSKPPLVLDLDALPEEAVDEAWHFAGQEWNAGQRWQDAFYALSIQNVDEIAKILASMDQLTRNTTPSDRLSPDWPLALAVLRRAGADHPDAAEILDDWRKLEPFDGLTDPVLLDLLAGRAATNDETVAVQSLPEPESEPAEPEVRLVDLLDRIQTQRQGGWEELLDDIVAARPRLTWAELPNAWDRVLEVEIKIGMRLDLHPRTKRAILHWLRVAPLLAVGEAAGDLDRSLVEGAILLALGVGPPEVAGTEQTFRVAHLLQAQQSLPAGLVDLLSGWQQSCQRLQEEGM